MNSLENNETSGRYTVPALERGLRLLSEFSRVEPVLSAPELARRLNLPRSTVFRMLTTLETLGFIEKTESGRDYRLGIAVLRLGFEYLASLELTELGMPILGRLRDAVSYACNLVVLDGRSIVYVAKVTPASWIASSVTVGTRLPAYATVLGRILLAESPLEKLRGLYPEHHLHPHTEKTPKTVIDLFDMLQRDTQSPCISEDGFFEKSISTTAAPVRDHSGRIVAALGVTVPFADMTPVLREKLITNVCTAAGELSSALGYRDDKAARRNVVHL